MRIRISHRKRWSAPIAPNDQWYKSRFFLFCGRKLLIRNLIENHYYIKTLTLIWADHKSIYWSNWFCTTIALGPIKHLKLVFSLSIMPRRYIIRRYRSPLFYNINLSCCNPRGRRPKTVPQKLDFAKNIFCGQRYMYIVSKIMQIARDPLELIIANTR